MNCVVVVMVAISIIVTGIAVATVATAQSEWRSKSDAHVRQIARERQNIVREKQNNKRLAAALIRIRDEITAVLDEEGLDESQDED